MYYVIMKDDGHRVMSSRNFATYADAYKFAQMIEPAFVVADVQGEISQAPSQDLSDAITPVPDGYDTVLGYLAKNHPDVMEQIDWRDPATTVRDGWKCSHLTARRHAGLPASVWVSAPKALQDAGIKQVRAYPLAVLEARWS